MDKLDGDDKNIQLAFHQILSLLRGRLASSAKKLLKHKWDNKNLENGWKNKVRPITLCLIVISFFIIPCCYAYSY